MADQSQSKKKGNTSWRPAQMLDVHGKKKNLHYRWADNSDPMRMQKLQYEGWVPASTVHGTDAAHDRPESVKDGNRLTSITEYRELTLMAIPADEYQEHRDYYKEQTRKQTLGLKKNLQAEMDAGASGTPAKAEGSIVIE